MAADVVAIARGGRIAVRLARLDPSAPIAIGVFLLLSLIRAGPRALILGSRWHGWFDQSRYYASTLAFAHGDLSAARHWYPLVYSLLAVPACALLPHNPYLLLDALCVGIVAECVRRVAALFGIGRWTALVLFLATGLGYPGLQNAWLEPWTSTLSAAFIWLLIARTGAIVAVAEPPAPAPRNAAWLGALAALIALTRPADAVVALVLGGGLAIHLAARRALSVRIAGAALAGAAAPLLGYALLYLAIYGLRPTDYMRGSVEIGLSFTDFGWKASVLLLDPRPWFPGRDAMLRGMPWLALGLAGALVALLRGPRAIRGYVAMLLAAVTAYVVILTAYVDLVPPGLWKFGNIHYFKWIFPLFGLLAWRFLRDARACPRTSLAVLAAIVAVTGLRFDAVPAAAGEPARRADFRAPPGDWNRVYFAQSVVTDGHRLRRTFLGYRQVPDGTIVRAIALRRDFAEPIAWYGDGLPQRTGVPRDGAATLLRGAWPAAPLRRWRAVLGWGAPCWLWRCADRR